jgi:hypothetical protein
MEEPGKLALPLELLVDPSLPLSASPPPPPPSPATSVSSQQSLSSTTSIGRKRLRQEWRSASLSTSPQQQQTLITSSSLEVEGASSTQEGIDAWRRRLRIGRTNHTAGAASSSLPRWMLRHASDKSDPTLVYQLSMDDHPDRHDADDSPNVDDFQPSEWTPPDSSYGAAIPIAGWIPKRIRRIIELSVSVILLALIGYLIITTSIWAERNRRDDTSGTASASSSSSVSGGKSNNGQLDLDDDRYMYYNNNKKDDEAEEEEFEQDVDDTDDYLAENGQGGNKRRLLLFSLVLDQLR